MDAPTREESPQWPKPPKLPYPPFQELGPALQNNKMIGRPNPFTIVVCPSTTGRVIMSLFGLAWTGAFGWLTWITATGQPQIPNAPLTPLVSSLSGLITLAGLVIIGNCGPRLLVISAIDRTYRYTDYYRLSVGRSSNTLRVPFIVQNEVGKLDEDVRGINITESVTNGQKIYWVDLIWNDLSRPHILLGGPYNANKARQVMMETSTLLTLPALGQ